MDLAHAIDSAVAVPPLQDSERARKRSLRKLWLVLSLEGCGFLGALPYFLPMLRTMTAAAKVQHPLGLVVLAQAVQVSLLTCFAAWAGVRLMKRSGFDAPYLHALVDGRPSGRSFLGELPRALFLGAAFSAAILLLNHFAGPHLPEALRSSAQAPPSGERLSAAIGGFSSAFYGGIVEELLLRWGVLSALVALFGVFGMRPVARFWAANLLSAILFGLGHLPAVVALGIPLGAAVIAFIVTANALAGICCGWLFQKRGLEAAMVAHGFGDICLHALPIVFAGLL